MNTAQQSANPVLQDWSFLDWTKIESYVRKLRQRIFRAEQLGHTRKVRKLQRLMLRSQANLLLSIKRVTQINRGKRTAGVDGHRALNPTERVHLFQVMNKQSVYLHNPKPARRTYIPKKKGKLRPLGIPTLKDRVWQNIVKNALEPQWEEKFESISYGFRPKRSTHDAIASIFNKANARTTKPWIFEGDFAGCFDNLNHGFIETQTKEFPASMVISKWLTAGYVDDETFHPTTSGTPQGGILSPLLANIALHGMEGDLGVHYCFQKGQGYRIKTTRSVVRYADDFIILCQTQKEAENMYDQLQPYLAKRGLELAEEKTKVVHITEGFDFLGFSIRQYKTQHGNKLLIKPSKDSIKTIMGFRPHP